LSLTNSILTKGKTPVPVTGVFPFVTFPFVTFPFVTFPFVTFPFVTYTVELLLPVFLLPVATIKNEVMPKIASNGSRISSPIFDIIDFHENHS
jgi:hypothetical protein